MGYAAEVVFFVAIDRGFGGLDGATGAGFYFDEA